MSSVECGESVSVHGALGHGCDVAGIAAYLLSMGKADIGEKLERIQVARPPIGLDAWQLALLQNFASR